MAIESDYLRAMLATLGRQAFPPELLAKLIAPAGDGSKQIAAYNLCDGEHTQAQIAAEVSLDKGSLSRSISRWMDEGIAVRIGELPRHIYRLPDGHIGRKPRSKNGN